MPNKRVWNETSEEYIESARGFPGERVPLPKKWKVRRGTRVDDKGVSHVEATWYKPLSGPVFKNKTLAAKVIKELTPEYHQEDTTDVRCQVLELLARKQVNQEIEVEEAAEKAAEEALKRAVEEAEAAPADAAADNNNGDDANNNNNNNAPPVPPPPTENETSAAATAAAAANNNNNNNNNTPPAPRPPPASAAASTGDLTSKDGDNDYDDFIQRTAFRFMTDPKAVENYDLVVQLVNFMYTAEARSLLLRANINRGHNGCLVKVLSEGDFQPGDVYLTLSVLNRLRSRGFDKTLVTNTLEFVEGLYSKIESLEAEEERMAEAPARLSTSSSTSSSSSHSLGGSPSSTESQKTDPKNPDDNNLDDESNNGDDLDDASVEEQDSVSQDDQSGKGQDLHSNEKAAASKVPNDLHDDSVEEQDNVGQDDQSGKGQDLHSNAKAAASKVPKVVSFVDKLDGENGSRKQTAAPSPNKTRATGDAKLTNNSSGMNRPPALSSKETRAGKAAVAEEPAANRASKTSEAPTDANAGKSAAVPKPGVKPTTAATSKKTDSSKRTAAPKPGIKPPTAAASKETDSGNKRAAAPRQKPPQGPVKSSGIPTRTAKKTNPSKKMSSLLIRPTAALATKTPSKRGNASKTVVGLLVEKLSEVASIVSAKDTPINDKAAKVRTVSIALKDLPGRAMSIETKNRIDKVSNYLTRFLNESKVASENGPEKELAQNKIKALTQIFTTMSDYENYKWLREHENIGEQKRKEYWGEMARAARLCKEAEKQLNQLQPNKRL